MKFRIFVLVVLMSTTALPLLAQNRTAEFGFQSDNDSFLGQGVDRYYTNGLFLFFRKGMNFNNPKLANKVLGIEVGQKIFNPQSGYVPDSTYIDRPFAGYLYAGVNINYLYRDQSNLKIGVQVGVVGPSAQGKQAQEVIHNTFGFYKLNGWQNQIKNSPQINLRVDYNKLIVRPNPWGDLTFSGYANGGTGFNGAGAGLLLRAGAINHLFNSVSTQATATYNSIAPLHKFELFAYYQPMINYVAYDVTVQGNLLKKDNDPRQITSKPEPVVLTHQIGAAFASSRFVVGLAANLRGKEVKTQVFNSHAWGSVTLLYRFNSHKNPFDVTDPKGGRPVRMKN